MFENIWRWWKFRTADSKMAIIPIFLSVFSGSVIFYLSMYFSNRDVYVRERAKIPEECNE
jgi:hypothetical protein